MEYGILVDKHNGYLIYQDGDKFTITTKKHEVVGTSNCLEGAYVVASLGQKEIKNIFKRRKR